MSKNNEKRTGAVKNSSNIHNTKNSMRLEGIKLHLCYCRKILRRINCIK